MLGGRKRCGGGAIVVVEIGSFEGATMIVNSGPLWPWGDDGDDDDDEFVMVCGRV
jgi:hypothetical protein